jgi:hypothetical protein
VYMGRSLSTVFTYRVANFLKSWPLYFLPHDAIHS